jgi:hypothetical protein
MSIAVIAGVIAAVVLVVVAVYFFCFKPWYDDKYGRKVNLSNDGLIAGFG